MPTDFSPATLPQLWRSSGENRRFRLCYREQEQRVLLRVHSLIVVSSEQCVLSLVYSLSSVVLAINLPVLSRSFPHVIRQIPRAPFQLLQAALFLNLHTRFFVHYTTRLHI